MNENERLVSEGKCPVCGESGENISADPPGYTNDGGLGECYVAASCTSCKAIWGETYTLTGVEIFEVAS